MLHLYSIIAEGRKKTTRSLFSTTPCASFFRRLEKTCDCSYSLAFEMTVGYGGSSGSIVL